MRGSGRRWLCASSTLFVCFGAAVARAQGVTATEPAAGVVAQSAPDSPAPEGSSSAAAPSPSASSGSPVRGSGGIVGFISTPYGGNQDDNGIGFGVVVNLGWGKIPVTVGLDVMTDFLADASSEQNVRTGNTFTPVRQSRSDKAYFFDLSLRLQPVDWLVRPYLEGVVGTKILTTEYTLSFLNSGTTTSSVSDHDWAGSIGWGAGVDLGGTSSHGVGLTLGVRRLNGGSASFARTVDTGNGQTTQVRYQVPTSNTFWMLGLIGSFGGSGVSQ